MTCFKRKLFKEDGIWIMKNLKDPTTSFKTPNFVQKYLENLTKDARSVESNLCQIDPKSLPLATTI
jgi:uncharacterized protein YfcZ (UPF0381/DUF406 family)